ncbi:hypothetical protein WJX81_001547 [Elliptochloris bilobata]|uniref:NADP-dependent oxidoreductase domain-containing protein n=1 Tax=Elliptochloris bilobata TaxID=381761 RepID=A0AAW1S1D5_9CHLO
MAPTTGHEVSALGIGAWSWGDRTGYWGWENQGRPDGYGEEENRAAYQALVDAGVTFLDTAEVYGFGKSEELVCDFIRRTPGSSVPFIATKFAPLPWRFTADTVEKALQASLRRLGQSSVGLYQIHWPGFPFINNWATDTFVEGLATVQQAGLAKAVGVSNFRADRMRKAHSILEARGVPLASNQVQYSLTYRAPERNGVMAACRELGVTLIAYSPMAQGLLTGKYTPGGTKAAGPRSGLFSDERLAAVQPLLGLMRKVGSEHGGKTCAQVAINWTICKGALPIPGAKNAKQAAEAAGALGWRLTADEVAALDAASDRLGADSMGAPFENW